MPWLVPIAAQIEAEARSFRAHAAPTSACEVSQELRFWLLTHCASARSLAMVSAITGEMVSSASSKAKPTAFCATARPKATSWSELMKEKAPAKASMPPQPARNERLRGLAGVEVLAVHPLLRAHRSLAMVSEITGELSRASSSKAKPTAFCRHGTAVGPRAGRS